MTTTNSLTPDITWLVTVRLNSPKHRENYGISEIGNKMFEIKHDNDWNLWQVLGKIEKILYSEMERGDFQILTIYCPKSDKGWKNFKTDCEFYSLNVQHK